MRFQFECDCGRQLSDFTRSESDQINAQIQCEECGGVYALTVSTLRKRVQPES